MRHDEGRDFRRKGEGIIQDPALPEETARMDLPGDALELKIVGDYLYLAGGSKGLSVIRLY